MIESGKPVQAALRVRGFRVETGELPLIQVRIPLSPLLVPRPIPRSVAEQARRWGWR